MRRFWWTVFALFFCCLFYVIFLVGAGLCWLEDRRSRKEKP